MLLTRSQRDRTINIFEGDCGQAVDSHIVQGGRPSTSTPLLFRRVAHAERSSTVNGKWALLMVPCVKQFKIGMYSTINTPPIILLGILYLAWYLCMNTARSVTSPDTARCS